MAEIPSRNRSFPQREKDGRNRGLVKNGGSWPRYMRRRDR